MCAVGASGGCVNVGLGSLGLCLGAAGVGKVIGELVGCCAGG